MPRKTPWHMGGAVGVEITPHMVEILLLLRAVRNSTTASRTSGYSKELLRSTVRYVECKLKAPLFLRSVGRGHSEWRPRREADEFFTWCENRPDGGRDYPLVPK